ncbi:putative mitochondrial protein [Trifolium repens]|nr:putative mitochondrial protein [Trifolium repens]
MTKGLNSWSSRHLSYGGHINFVLASLPLYFISFYKVPCCVIKQLVKMQHNFLWGGGLIDKRLCWVSWDQICLPKERGGLGVKNLSLFNNALLGKWKWRLLNEGDAIWADLLRLRYGHLPTQLLAYNAMSYNIKSSLWWRDTISIERGINENWFMSNIGCCVGEGKNVGFWRFQWFGDQPFNLLFPELFAKETFKDFMIAQRIQSNGLDRVWTWNWQQQLTHSVAQQLAELQELLHGF